MTTVRDLVDQNPLYIEAILLKDAFITRMKGINHSHMIRGYDDVITDQEQKISYRVQLVLYGLNLALTIGVALLAASRVGTNYWKVACAGIIPGIFIGIMRPISIFEAVQLKSDIYACYTRRYKILQPLHETAFKICALGTCSFLIYNIRPLAYLNAFFLGSYLSCEITSVFISVFRNTRIGAPFRRGMA